MKKKLARFIALFCSVLIKVYPMSRTNYEEGILEESV